MIRSATILLLSFLLIIGACQKQADKAEVPQVVVDSVASADGVMIHYTDYGGGDRAVVFSHGWGGDGSYWVRQVDALKDDYRVVTLDLAGHGNSGTNRQDWTVGHFGEDIAAVVNKLDLKEVILVGHSMSGTVCIEAARILPEKVVATIGVDTYQNLSARPSPEQIEGFVGPFRVDFAGAVNEFIPSIFGPNADSALVAQVTADISQLDSAIGVACFEGLFAYDVPAALTEMRKPVRAVSGDLWPTNVEGNRQVAQSFEVEIIEGVGHFPHLESPAEFNLRLLKVLRSFWPAETQN